MIGMTECVNIKLDISNETQSHKTYKNRSSKMLEYMQLRHH